MNEDKGQGQLEMTVSRLLDQKVSPLSNLQQELEARKRETEVTAGILFNIGQSAARMHCLIVGFMSVFRR